MNTLTVAVFVIVLAAANAGIIGLHGFHGLHGLHGLVGSGIEGQYIPSGLERLYDDGSYRGEHVLSRVGIIGHGGILAIPAGSGLEGQVGVIGSGLEGQVGLIGSGIEGQYIPSGLERLSDDGSYRGEHHLAGHNLILH